MASSKKKSTKKVARPVLGVNHSKPVGKKKAAKAKTKHGVGKKIAVKKADTLVPAPVPAVTRTKTHVYLLLDESGSMDRLASAASAAAQRWLTGIRTASAANKQETYVTLVFFHAYSRAVAIDQPIEALDVSLATVRAGGSTALHRTADSYARAAYEKIRNTPDSVLFLVVTDGDNTDTPTDPKSMRAAFAQLVSTDRADIALMVPPGYKARAAGNCGLRLEDVREWEASAEGLARATEVYNQSFDTYYANRSRGVASNRSIGSSFYVDPDDLKKVDLDKLTDISGQIQMIPVTHRDPERIDEFYQAKLSRPFEKGKLFYELTKSEDLRPGRTIVVQDMATGKVFGGDEARSVLGLDFNNKVKIRPGKDKKRRVFVQSTSLNRKLVVGTEVVHWSAVRP